MDYLPQWDTSKQIEKTFQNEAAVLVAASTLQSTAVELSHTYFHTGHPCLLGPDEIRHGLATED